MAPTMNILINISLRPIPCCQHKTPREPIKGFARSNAFRACFFFALPQAKDLGLAPYVVIMHRTVPLLRLADDDAAVPVHIAVTTRLRVDKCMAHVKGGAEGLSVCTGHVGAKRAPEYPRCFRIHDDRRLPTENDVDPIENEIELRRR